MAGKQIAGDGFPSNFAGMSKNQLYDIMSQMKILIEQNQQQARQILIENPLLTRALFQAQIMLGMVQPPQVIPNIKPALPQQSIQSGQQLNNQVALPSTGQGGLQDQAGATQIPVSGRKQQPDLPQMPIPSTSVPPVALQSQTMSLHPLQSVLPAKGNLNSQMTSFPLPQSSQIQNIPPLAHHSASQTTPLLQSQIPTVSGQSQQSLQNTGVPHLPLQPPLPPQPRPPLMPPFPHQFHSQMGPNLGFQPSGAPQSHHSQPSFHSGNKPSSSIGLPFSLGQPPLHNQPSPQTLYQAGGPLMGTDFSNQSAGSMQVERMPARMPGLPENAMGMQLPGPPPLLPGQIGPGNQSRPPGLTPEMEKALLQQVMSLTPDQINLLPPEQRHQVLQLQQMLR